MSRCPDCGRVISLHFPIHVCDPTDAWRKENPGVAWVIQHADGTYVGRRGSDVATRFPSAQAAQEEYDRLGLGRWNTAKIVRVEQERKPRKPRTQRARRRLRKEA